MAAQLQSISIDAPGFFGLNTQDSPTSLPEQFALVANNCVIDQSGRVAARKGFEYFDNTVGKVASIGEFINPNGANEIISVSSTGVFTGTNTLTNVTPTGYNVGNGDYQQASLQQFHYLFKEGSEPLYYDGSVVEEVNSSQHSTGTAPKAGVVVSAYGRLFAARTDTDKTTVFFSDLLLGKHWAGGTSGQLNVAEVWAGGADEITAIAAHNNFLIIFGSTQILVFSGANGDPNNDLQLQDTVVGVGCVAKDSIQKIGSDLLFLSDTGVRSFNRTIQEKSMPLRDVSKNVRTDLITSFMSSKDTGFVKSGYSPIDAFYILSIEGSNESYVFDTRQPLQDGSFRATKWQMSPTAFLTTQQDKELLLGETLGLAQYKGFLDNQVPYQLNYFTNYIDFGNPNNIKFLKSLFGTFISQSNAKIVFNYDYDYNTNYRKRVVTLDPKDISEFGIGEFGLATFTLGTAVSRPSIKTSASGAVVQFGIDATIEGAAFSIQRLTAQATLGRSI
jgi:hypothetical protein